ncbi:MAG: tRNA glutamyl-Q(34) synthetase GluQRS [Deltaproteobacteria bacterium]|nr:tRNA glutamyl-Q(34) synthetase GluQRS [Deltaproteobacteria bacterium]
MRERFAPSPTGDLHLGGAYVALAAFLRARATGGAFVVRMEDLDPPRVVPGAADRILDDLCWLGLGWDEGPRVGGPFAPYEQSRRQGRYDAAIAELAARGLVYPCTCTRAEIARAASAPHAGEEGPRYPGTCRDPARRREGRPAALRLRVPDEIIRFVDAIAGARAENVAETVGDFVLRRADGVASYQLAVVVDDLEMRIDEVVRGDDLLPSTARQVLLARLLGGEPPRWVHLPLVLGPDGERLAKRHQSRFRGSTVAELREAGVAAEEIVGVLAAALGVTDAPRPAAPDALIAAARERAPARTAPFHVPEAWVRPRASH